MEMTDRFLERIVESKRQQVNLRLSEDPDLAKIKRKAQSAPPVYDFYKALTQNPHRLSVIAEIKRASPSRGIMDEDLNADSQARAYQALGASAISVLTEETYFRGSLEDIEAARDACSIPILRKDFIIHPYQVYEARASGADAILLIAALLPDDQIKALTRLAHDIGMSALVEVHAEAEVKEGLDSGAIIIGINNRDLATFKVDIETTRRLAPLIPKGHVLVSESGILGTREAQMVASCGAHAILVGEALIKSRNLKKLMKELTGVRCGPG